MTGKRGKWKTREEILIDMRVSGMMRLPCETAVRNAPEAFTRSPGGTADQVTGRVTVLMAKDLEVSRLKKVVEACDYTVVEVKRT